MFGHDNHDNQIQVNDNTQSAPLPPEPIADGTLATDATTVPVVSSDVAAAIDDMPPVHPSMPMPVTVTPPVAPGLDGGGDLLDIKQQALQQLTPLVGHLDQTPEEKFRTTMMMIQGSDNQSLIKTAYEAAQQITDEKLRAQALLDIVNEINYFTQHPAAS